MYILAIETTGPAGSVALLGTGTKVRADSGENVDIQPFSDSRDGTFVPVPKSASLQYLVPAIRELFDEQGIDGNDIAAVAASCGPGSFTGIRIGVSTARALAQAWNVPCISVPTLETFREKCGGCQNEHGEMTDTSDKTDYEQHSEKAPWDGSICVIFNARRGQVYGACFGRDGETLIAPGPYMLTDVLDDVERLGISPKFYGDGVDAYFESEEFSERVKRYHTAPAEERCQTADMTARFALDKWNRGETVQYGELTPDYMRESEAEQRLKDGSLERMRKQKLERLMKMAGKN